MCIYIHGVSSEITPDPSGIQSASQGLSGADQLIAVRPPSAFWPTGWLSTSMRNAVVMHPIRGWILAASEEEYDKM